MSALYGLYAQREHPAPITLTPRLPRSTAESLLHIFLADTETSRAKGREFLGRFMAPGR